MSIIDEIEELKTKLAELEAQKEKGAASAMIDMNKHLENAKSEIKAACKIADSFGLSFKFEDAFDYVSGTGGLGYYGKGSERWDSSQCYGEDDFLTSGEWVTSTTMDY